MSHTTVDHTLEEISLWCKGDGTFGYVFADRKLHGCLIDRARELISRCLSPGVRVVYCVLNGWERDILASALKVSTDFSKSERACVLSHADLYGLSKPTTRDQVLSRDVVVLCEVDAQVSLEYSLALYNLIYGVETSTVQGAHVLMVSNGVPYDAVFDLLECVAPSVGGLSTFDLRVEDHAPTVPDAIESKVLDATTGGDIIVTLGKGADVLIYCSELDRGCLISIMHGFYAMFNRCVIEVGVCDVRKPFLSFLTAMNKRGEVQIHGDTVLRSDLPTLFVVYGADRMPFRIKDLGLVVIIPRRTRVMFSRKLGQVVKTSTGLSRSEFLDAVTAADLSKRSDVRVLSGVTINDLKSSMPPKRIENDQHQAFLFELFQTAQSAVAKSHVMRCFDINPCQVEASGCRLLSAGLIERMETDEMGCFVPKSSRTSEVGLGYSILKTDRTRKLPLLLPALDFHLELAAFLSDVMGPKSTSRVAIRLAAIMHCHDLFLSYDPEGWCAQRPGAQMQDFEDHLQTELAPFCIFPPNILKEGTLWIKLAVWNRLSMWTSGFTKDVTDFDEFLLTETMDTFGYTALAGSILVSRSACLKINEIVQSLEKTLNLPWQPPARIIVAEWEARKFKSALLCAYSDRVIWFSPKENQILHQGGKQTANVLRPYPKQEYLHLAEYRDGTRGTFPALSLEVSRIVQDGVAVWQLGNIVIMPIRETALRSDGLL